MEMGKPLTQARGEIAATQARVRYLVDNASSVLQPHTMSRSATFEERVEYEPLGVVANISAYNYPYFTSRSVPNPNPNPNPSRSVSLFDGAQRALDRASNPHQLSPSACSYAAAWRGVHALNPSQSGFIGI
jgi:hypothetical protein